jgi:hypothetical protein
MRKTLLATAAALGVGLAVPALAQDQPPHRPVANAPTSRSHGEIAPALPAPALGPNATPEQYLQAAQRALQQRRGGAAQEALERAETRLLDRATAPSRANEPDTAPAVREISQAIDALGRRDWQAASQHTDAAMQAARTAQAGGSTSSTSTSAGQAAAPVPTPTGGQGIVPAAPMTGPGAAATPAASSWNPSYDSHYPPANAAGAPPPGSPMTAGQSSTPMGGVMPPNGGVMAPNGGIMAPNVP